MNFLIQKIIHSHIHLLFIYFSLSLITDRIIAPVFRVSVEVIVVLDHYVMMVTRTIVKMVVFASKCLTNLLTSLLLLLSIISTLTHKNKIKSEIKIFQHS